MRAGAALPRARGNGYSAGVLHLPDPLHPFAVHFPVAFLLMGIAASWVALVWPDRRVLTLASAALLLGALSASWAHATGVTAAAEVRYVGQSVAAAVQEHKNVSDLMLFAAWLSAAAAAAAWFVPRLPGAALGARLASVAAGVFLLWTMQASLHTGSELTHTHFFGTNAPKPPLGTEEVVRLRVK